MASIAYLQRDPRSGLIQEANPPQIPDQQHNIPTALGGERGATWSEMRQFEWYEEGLIFLRGPIEDYEIEGMLKWDGRARAVEQALTLPIRGARWEIHPGDHDTGERDFAEQLLTEPGDMGGMKTTIRQVIAQASMASLYRASCFEKVYKLNDQGQVVYDKVAYRPPTSCYLARSAKTAQLEGFLQWTWTDIANFQRIYIPTAKSWVFLHGVHRDPIRGSSDIEVAYRAFQTKQKLRWLWAAWLENQLMPKTTVTGPTTDVNLTNDMAAKVAKLRGGGTIGLPAGWQAKPLEAGSEGVGQAFASAVAYCDEEIYSSILASFLGLGTASGVRGGGGSFALSLSQTDFFLQSRYAVLDELAESITHSLIAPMIRWNFGHRASLPRFRFVGMAPTQNITESVVQMVSALVAMPPAPGTQSPVPAEFIDEMLDVVAGQIGLDGPKVHDAIEKHRARLEAMASTPEQVAAAPVHATADVLAAAMGRARNGNRPAMAAGA